MIKIPCLFVRNFFDPPPARGIKNFELTTELTPGCEWVVAGVGTASRKWDGIPCMVTEGGELFTRFDAKEGRKIPAGAVPCEPAADPVTGHWPHWVPVLEKDPVFKWHLEAWHSSNVNRFPGTYELLGPKANGNSERLDRHYLQRHGEPSILVGRTFHALRAYLETNAIEGIVFFDHDTGRMAKIRRDDFGMPWPVPK